MKNIIFNKPWLGAVLSGILIGIAYLPFNLGFLVYIGFVFIIDIWLNEDFRKNIISSYIFGLVYNIISNYWISTNSGVPFSVAFFSLISAVVYLALFWAIAGGIFSLLREKKIIYYCIPFLLVSLEWVRSFGALGFPWGNIALTQTNYLPLIQHADIAGPYVVIFFVVIINLLIYDLVKGHLLTFFEKFTLIFFCISYVTFGFFKFWNTENKLKSVNVSVIQPNIDPNEKWKSEKRNQTFNFMDSLYLVAINQDPDLILFPETALPTYIRLNSRVRNKLQNKVNESGIPILIGTVDRLINDKKQKYLNSSIFMKPHRNFEMYSKMHLVPFAEYDLLPSLSIPLSKLNINIERGVFEGGKDYKIFQFNDNRFANLICYESSFPRYARNFVKNGAQLLFIQANDGWLGKSAGPYQHFENARLRAVENRVSVVRAGNTGISGIISPKGQVQRKISLGLEAVFNDKVMINNKLSIYSRYGDIFAALCVLTFLFLGPVKCLKTV